MKIDSSCIISRVGTIAQRMFEERMLVITPKNSMLHRLNEVGTFIWQQLETPKTVEELAASVKYHFSGVEEVQLEQDLAAFLEKLAERKLIECGSEKEPA